MKAPQNKILLASLLVLAGLSSCSSDGEYDLAKESRSKAFDLKIIRRPVYILPDGTRTTVKPVVASPAVEANKPKLMRTNTAAVAAATAPVATASMSSSQNAPAPVVATPTPQPAAAPAPVVAAPAPVVAAPAPVVAASAPKVSAAQQAPAPVAKPQQAPAAKAYYLDQQGRVVQPKADSSDYPILPSRGRGGRGAVAY